MGSFVGLNNISSQKIDISWVKKTDITWVTLANLNQLSEINNSVTMYGGNDTVIGSNFNDSILGGAGNDSLNGMAGNDFLSGEAGNDILLGGTGNDSLYGGTGNDTLNGQLGNDYLVGGSGNDTYIHNPNSGADRINDVLTVNLTGAMASGGGTDTLQFTGIRFFQIVAGKSGNDLILTSVFDTTALLDAVTIENYFLGGNSKIEIIGGSDYSQAINYA